MPNNINYSFAKQAIALERLPTPTCNINYSFAKQAIALNRLPNITCDYLVIHVIPYNT